MFTVRFARFILFGLFLVAGPWPGSAQCAELLPLSITGPGGTRVFNVELAVTDAERARGLMYRRSMADGVGMLFDFGDERSVSMWMRNTYISLDMIFIRADGQIGHIAANTTPLSDTIISSGIEARFVLEVNAGASRHLSIMVGDRVHGPAIDDLL